MSDNWLPAEPETARTIVGSPVRCRHPRQFRRSLESGDTMCTRCGSDIPAAATRMGRHVGQRAKREERSLAKRYSGTREGHKGGPIDVATGLLAIQSKAGSGWWSARYALELDKLPRTGGRAPALIVSNGMPGNLCRRFVVMDERDYRALYGDRILDGDQP